ncbi:hypothetical protein [Flavobacterium sp.]|uniref:hypothetical protein n=1 Tax=Flavobacterium sp. TaxID=239 RepID=UPI0026042935|nr:hypothetical protein [Flavobacterium sp.]
MITVKVSYTVNPEFVETNKKNISLFLEDFKKMNADAFKYTVYLKEDGVTFVHFSSYINEEIQNEILNVPSFKFFQKMRDESGLNDTHRISVLNYVGSSFPVF